MRPVFKLSPKALLGISMIAIVVISFVIYTAYTTNIFTPPPKDWHTYKDPDGYFTIQIPDNWNVEKSDEGEVYLTIKDQSFNYKQPATTFSDKTGNAAIQVIVAQYGEAMQKRLCDVRDPNVSAKYTTTFAGLPASTFNKNNWYSFLFDTKAAHYQVGYKIRDHLGGHPPGAMILNDVPTPTSVSLPHEVVSQNKKAVDYALKTFKPIPVSPNPCNK